MAVRGATGIVLAFRADTLGELVLEDLAEVLEAEGDRDREQVLLGNAGQLGQRERDLLGQVEVGEALLCDDARTRYLGHRAVLLFVCSPVFTRWDESEDRLQIPRTGGQPPLWRVDGEIDAGRIVRHEPTGPSGHVQARGV